MVCVQLKLEEAHASLLLEGQLMAGWLVRLVIWGSEGENQYEGQEGTFAAAMIRA